MYNRNGHPTSPCPTLFFRSGSTRRILQWPHVPIRINASGKSFPLVKPEAYPMTVVFNSAPSISSGFKPQPLWCPQQIPHHQAFRKQDFSDTRIWALVRPCSWNYHLLQHMGSCTGNIFVKTIQRRGNVYREYTWISYIVYIVYPSLYQIP